MEPRASCFWGHLVWKSQGIRWVCCCSSCWKQNMFKGFWVCLLYVRQTSQLVESDRWWEDSNRYNICIFDLFLFCSLCRSQGGGAPIRLTWNHEWMQFKFNSHHIIILWGRWYELKVKKNSLGLIQALLEDRCLREQLLQHILDWFQ